MVTIRAYEMLNNVAALFSNQVIGRFFYHGKNFYFKYLKLI
jgi:hypothetical protein